MRQIAFDTETTGLSTDHGHRVIEIGCIEIVNRRITGKSFHCYIDPDREIEGAAFAIHGISNEFLLNKPKFSEVIASLLDFITGSELIIHNAPFDVGFLNHEFNLAGHPKSVNDYCTIFDTLVLARQLHPGQKNNLDALCKRYEVDNSHRQAHGALLDADLLARIYLAMTGGQESLFLETQSSGRTDEQQNLFNMQIGNKVLPVIKLSDDERKAHLEFLELLKKNSGETLWE